ncbi:hypothetical protein [Ferrimonas sp. YFM]|uniref:hypothetical protein n=1 Tax=Ferrimonas sp. YFM TaxID=3028878 RepID=UPI0025729604|nr:hypothetical protein [Ferrimonas sp. YFM]BDY05724.1 hypothetical protein F0521_27650 [Ferrimonas sp. YFM]
MGSIEIAVTQSKRIEAALTEQFGAEGRGLHEKVSSVEHQLPKLLIRQIRWIATLRNKAVHEPDFSLNDPDEFVRRADHVMAQLKALQEQAAAKAVEPQAHKAPAADTNAAWQEPGQASLPKALNWVLGLGLCLLLLKMGVSLYEGKLHSEAQRERAERRQRPAAEVTQAASEPKQPQEQSLPASSKPVATVKPKSNLDSASTSAAESTGGTTIKVATAGLASKVQQAQDGLSQGKAQLSEQLLLGMMNNLTVTVGEISAAADDGGKVSLLLPLSWQVEQPPLLKVINEHFRDYKGRAITGGRVALDKGRDKLSDGIVIERLWNQGEHQHQAHSEVLFRWLVTHQLRLEARFAGQSASLVLASGRDCHVGCRGRGDDQFQLLTAHRGKGEPLMLYREQNPLRITGLTARSFDKGAALSLALVLVEGEREVARRDLSTLLPDSQFAGMARDATQQWQQMQQQLQQNVIDAVLQQAGLQVGELRVEPADAGHSNLYIPLHWQLPENRIVAELNRHFHDYRRRPLSSGAIEINGRFGPKLPGIEVVQYANKLNNQKHPLSERAYQFLLDNPIGVRARIGKQEGRLYLTTGLDCHVNCRVGGKDRYRILFSDKQSGKQYGDRRANELLIEGVPNAQLSKLDGLTLTIERL